MTIIKQQNSENNTLIFTAKEKSINDFDSIVCQHNGTDVAIGHFLKFYWYPIPTVRFYDLEALLNNYHSRVVSFCTDDLLIRLYKESICSLALLRNIPIQSFPDEYLIFKEKFENNESYDIQNIIPHISDSFYKSYTKYFTNGINIHKTYFLIQALADRGLSKQVQILPEDINNIFTPKHIIKCSNGVSPNFFLNIPTTGNNLELLDKYLDQIVKFKEIINESWIDFTRVTIFCDDFKHMYQILNDTKNKELLPLTKKHFSIALRLSEEYPNLFKPSNCKFLKDITRLKKKTKDFGYSILEDDKSSSMEVDFDIFKTKTILINCLDVLKYQREKYNKVLTPQYVLTTLKTILENLSIGVISISGHKIYFSLFEKSTIDEEIFNKAIDNFIQLILKEPLSPRVIFKKEYEIIMTQATMETDILKLDNQQSTGGKKGGAKKF